MASAHSVSAQAGMVSARLGLVAYWLARRQRWLYPARRDDARLLGALTMVWFVLGFVCGIVATLAAAALFARLNDD